MKWILPAAIVVGALVVAWALTRAPAAPVAATAPAPAPRSPRGGGGLAAFTSLVSTGASIYGSYAAGSGGGSAVGGALAAKG